MKNQEHHTCHHFSLLTALAGLVIVTILLVGTASGQVRAASWSFTGNLNAPRWGHTATLLGNGKVLVAGGVSSGNTAAELYNPNTGTWSYTGYSNLLINRHGHTGQLVTR